MQEMSVLILGENSLNNYISEFFADKGINVVIVPDIFNIRSLSGESGSFILKTKDADTNADFVILTEQPTAEPVVIDGLPAKTLYEESMLNETASTEPVVFLLDYISESPMAATISALSSAVRLARNKRKVYYLAKFIRTAGRGIEALYREAREAGVTFIKYESLQISADLSEDIFSLSAFDGEIELTFKTKHLFSDGGLDVGERFAYVVKKLNLTANKLGYLTEDTYYLTPALTSRRGVYHLTRDLIAERPDEGLDYIYSHAVSGIWEAPSFGVAEINGKKCVFCYNCFRACPHAALEPDLNAAQMQCLSAACAGCGICTGLCPANAIKLEKDTACANDGVDGIMGVYGIGGSCGTEKSVLAVYCENSATPDKSISDIDVLTVPCGGLIDMGLLSDAISSYDRIISIVCPDDACRHFDGNKRSCALTKRLHDMLDAAGLSSDKVQCLQVSQAMPGVFRDGLRGLLNDNC